MVMQKEKEVSQKTITVLENLSKIKFQSQDFVDEVNEWDLQRVRLEEDLSEFERKLLEDKQIKSKDDQDSEDDDF